MYKMKANKVLELKAAYNAAYSAFCIADNNLDIAWEDYRACTGANYTTATWDAYSKVYDAREAAWNVYVEAKIDFLRNNKAIKDT